METLRQTAPMIDTPSARPDTVGERGASLIEYVLLIATVAVVSTLGLGLVRNITAGAFEDAAGAMEPDDLTLVADGWRRTVRAEEAGAVTFEVLNGRIRVADVVARGGWDHDMVLSTYEAVVTFEDAERSIQVSASLSDGDLNTQVVAVAGAYAAG